MPTFHSLTDCFKNSFSLSTLNDWYKLDETLRNSESISIFKSRLLSFIRPLKSNVYNIFDPIGLKFLTRLRLGFSHLNEHRFRNNFQDCMNPLCSCNLKIEDTSQYLLQYKSIAKSILEYLSLCLTMLKKIYFYMVTHV